MIKKSVFVITVLLSVSLAGCLDESTSDSTSSVVDSEVILLDVINDCTNLEIYLQIHPLL
mgnify:CR=1 FL=1